MSNLREKLERLDKKGCAAHFKAEADKCAETEGDWSGNSSSLVPSSPPKVQEPEELSFKDTPTTSQYEIEEEDQVESEHSGGSEGYPDDEDTGIENAQREVHTMLSIEKGLIKDKALKILETISVKSPRPQIFNYDLSDDQTHMMGALLNWIYQTSWARYRILRSDKTSILISYQEPGTSTLDETPKSAPNPLLEKATHPELSELERLPTPECNPTPELMEILRMFRNGIVVPRKSRNGKSLLLNTNTKGFSEDLINALIMRNPSMQLVDVIKNLSRAVGTFKLMSSLYDISKFYERPSSSNT